jgi:hypothetical protein
LKSTNESFKEASKVLRVPLRDGRRTRTDTPECRSQCKQFQEAIFRRLEEQSQKTEANALKLNRAETSLQDTLYHLHEVTLPTFIYSYKEDTDQLHRTSLVTGEQSSHQVPSYTFKDGC